jgi:Fe2+ or Zn2+ uptake regulation protein
MKNKVKEILKEAKLKVTPARVALLGIFSAKCQPMSADNVIAKLKRTKIDNVTVYRTLASLEKANIIQRVDLRKESVYFELSNHHHHHFVCTSCGVVEKLPKCNVGQIISKSLKQSKRFSIVRSHSFELFGLCKTCA